MGSEEETEEEIECTGCGETPWLVYDPTKDEPLRLTCDCEFGTVGVTDCLNDSALLEPFSGRWSNVDKDSTLRYGE